MDAVFGPDNFRSEIIWRRSNAHNKLTKQYGPIHDTLLFYSKGKRFTFHPGRTPYTSTYVKKNFPYSDSHGKYQSNVLTGSGTRAGESGEPWRGYDPHVRLRAASQETERATRSTGTHGRHWAIPSSIRSLIKFDTANDSVQRVLDKLDALSLIIHPRTAGKMPRYKQYLSSSHGVL